MKLNSWLETGLDCDVLLMPYVPKGITGYDDDDDITFMNKKTKNTILIDIAVPNTHNLVKTITDKQNKYQEQANEICAMWKQKAAQVILIVISSTGVIPK